MKKLDPELLERNKKSEIMSAYVAADMIEKTVEVNRKKIGELADTISAHRPEKLILSGSGASYCMLYTPHYYLKSFSSIANVHEFGPVLMSDDEIALEKSRAYALLASYSGKTADTVATSAFLKARGVPRIAVSRDAEGPLARSCENVLTYNDKCLYTSAMVNVLALVAELQKRNGEIKTAEELLMALARLPDQMRSVIHKSEEMARSAVEEIGGDDFFYVLGDGALWGLAYQFGYTNLMEYSRVHAACLRSCEWRHGPLEVLFRKPAMIMFIGDDRSRENTLATKAYCERNGARVVAFDVKDFFDTHPALGPFAVHAVSQFFFLYQSTQRGISMDDYLEMHVKPYKPGETYF